MINLFLGGFQEKREGEGERESGGGVLGVGGCRVGGKNKKTCKSMPCDRQVSFFNEVGAVEPAYLTRNKKRFFLTGLHVDIEETN